MKRAFESLTIIAILLAVSPVAAGAQDGATQTQIEQRDPDFCGAGGAGCDPADMQVRMIAAGWNEADARAALASGIAQVFPSLTAPVVALPVVPDTGMIWCEGREIKVTLRLASPAVALCENVLSSVECAELLAFAHDRGLRPSTVVDEVSGENLPHPERTSSGVMLSALKPP